MSAAASPALAPRGKQRRAPELTEQEAKSRVVMPAEKYTVLPNEFFDTLPAKCSGMLEYIAVMQIARRTFGGEGRPMYAPLPAADLQRIANASTIDACEDALANAEAKGLVESRMDGRKKVYRVCEIRAVDDRPQRKLKKSKNGPVSLGEWVHFEAGRHAQTITWSDRTVDCNAESQIPFDLRATPVDDRKLRIDFKCGEDKAKHSGTGVGVSENPDRHNTRSGLRVSKRSSVENKASSVSNNANPSRQELASMQELLMRWCVNFGPRLSIPDDYTVRNACLARGQATNEQLARKLRDDAQKISKAQKPWAFVIHLIRSLATGAEKAARLENAPKVSKEEFTVESLVELELQLLSGSSAMDTRELERLEAKNPGVVARVARSCPPDIQALARSIGYS